MIPLLSRLGVGMGRRSLTIETIAIKVRGGDGEEVIDPMIPLLSRLGDRAREEVIDPMRPLLSRLWS